MLVHFTVKEYKSKPKSTMAGYRSVVELTLFEINRQHKLKNLQSTDGCVITIAGKGSGCEM